MSPQSGSAPAARRLNTAGQVVVGLIFAAGVALVTYAGVVLGMIVGVMIWAENANTPKPGVGLAPDLSGPIDLFLGVGAGGLLGGGLGLVAGLALLWAACRYLLAPLLRNVPGLGRP